VRKKFLFGKEWFFEETAKLGESQSFAWGVIPEKVIFSGKTPYQHIEIFDTADFGRMLVLDGLIQLCTKYEYVYHEMLVHPALLYHPHPRRVLIIGGGDGGAVREAVKHPLEEVALVDIDKRVIDVSRKYLPTVSAGAFRDPRVKIYNEDAVNFIKRYPGYFDVIINDSTDEYGPSHPLWSSAFYKGISGALRRRGIAGFQTAYFREGFAKKARKAIRGLFSFFKVHRAYIGCFPFDECTFSFASQTVDLARVSRKTLRERYTKAGIQTRYYSPDVHFASGVIPGERILNNR
jgi:spermidine synthase